MKLKMQARMKNYAGHERPVIVQRVELEDGSRGVLVKNPNKKLKIQKG